MELDLFREYGHRFVDWIVDYYQNIESYPVLSQVGPGDIRRQLPLSPPDEGEDMERIFDDFKKIILPGVTHWQHPSFFAYFPANSSVPSLLGEMLTAALGAQCMVWQTSPSGTELEEVVTEWLRQMIGLPEGFVGVIQDTASTATLCALICARERSTDFSVNRYGFTGEEKPKRLAVYSSEHAHSSIEKGAKIAGFGREQVRLIPVDEKLRLVPEELEKSIQRDLASGITPCCVVAALGTTSSMAVDPLRPIGELCKKHGLWFHVDAAMAGSAAVLPEFRFIMDGVEYADSFVFNPHKWLFTNFDCSAYFCRDAGQLVNTFSITPEYLKTDVDMRVKNLRDWGIPLGRRFRALKLWFVLRFFGVKGIQDKLREHIRLAEEFAGWVQGDERFELVTPVSMNLVCFRYNPGKMKLSEGELERVNKALLDELNAGGGMYLTHTKLGGKYTLRMCIGQTSTGRKQVEEAWKRIRSAKLEA